ncbi:hypothetical protein BG003_005627 [Podila horticola]|nr:hypothetical protein BG003_005627 [Podila horticola]
MKQLLIFPLSLLPPLTIDALRNISLRPLAQFMTTLGHVPHKFVLLLFVHFTYFHAFRFFSPAIRNDKKRLSWCLTWVSTSVLSIMSLMTVYCSCRTVLHSRIPYEMYNRVDPVSGFAYRRYDAVFPPRSYSGIHSSLGSSSDLHKQDLHSREICLEAFSLVYLAPMATSGNTTKTTSFIANEQCQCTQEQFQRDMYDFYNHVDSTFYAPSSSAKASYPAWSFAAFFGRFSIPLRLFFDASFSPVRDALTEWAVLVLASYLVMDLTLGRRYYRERISFVGGYVHHSMYLYICCVALYTDYTVGMVLFFFDEIPTAVLGTGFVFPQLRHDTLFGLVYFVTRMVLDPLMTHEILRNTTMTPMGKFVTVIKNPLNVKFFIDYIQQQKRLRRQKNNLKDKVAMGVHIKEEMKVGNEELS